MTTSSQHQTPTQTPASPDALLKRLRAAGLALRTTQTAFHQTGLDFLVVHAVDDDGTPWIVRTPRRADVVAAAVGEARVLALIADKVSARVPDWRVHDADVIAYPRLPGTPVLDLIEGVPQWQFPLEAVPPPFVDDLARFLASLQAIDADVARAAGVVIVDSDAARAEQARFIAETRALLQPSDRLWARWQRWLDDDRLWPSTLALSHGDLHPGHWLVDDDQRLVGVLDWTEAKLGDPAVDFAMVYGCCGEATLTTLLTRFAAHGGAATSTLATHAKRRWSAMPTAGAAWALRTGNDAVIEHVKAQLAVIEANEALIDA